MSEDYGLGRLQATDWNDLNYLFRSAGVPAVTTRQVRYWYANGWWGDQNGYPQCVAYTWAHWLEDGPVTQKGSAPIVNPQTFYHECQQNDEWEGEGYDGTSIRAGAKVLQAKGLIESYHWGMHATDVMNAVLEVAPVPVGTLWYTEMFTPKGSMAILEPNGVVEGGHAYLVNGYSRKNRLFRIKNSWGRNWGRSGHAYIGFDELDQLIKDNGEACLAVERKQ